MKVDRVEISRLRYESYPDRYKADVCLHLHDRAGNPAGLVHLNCKATSSNDSDRAAIADKLLGDARRQMAYRSTPESGGEVLDFTTEMAVSLAD
ncbi:MAG: hypothetical protein LJE68_02655 [Rhodobacter sp.]|nr:hypothetical protein [Rhodobacter sp.]